MIEMILILGCWDFDLGEGLILICTREIWEKKIFLIDWEEGSFGLLILCHLSNACASYVFYISI